MKSIKYHFSDRDFVYSFIGGVLLLAISVVIQLYASNYATRIASDSVTDIVLSNTSVHEVGGIFVWGAVILTVISVIVGIMNIKSMPFTMKSVAIFTAIRSVFVSLTHISPFPTKVLLSSTFFSERLFNGIFNGNDLFFSGHTGLPFLLALIFWDHKILRYIFLGFSVVFAITVLLGHLHYSIDVLAAFFITYAIFDICKFIFKKDWQLFSKNSQ